MVCTLTAIPRGFEADVFTGWLDDLPNCNQQHRITDDTTYFEWGHLSSSPSSGFLVWLPITLLVLQKNKQHCNKQLTSH